MNLLQHHQHVPRDIFDEDPTMSACCQRDAEDRRKAALLRSQLDAKDIVRRTEDRRRRALEVSFHQEEDCSMLRAVARGNTVACLAVRMVRNDALEQMCKQVVMEEWDLADLCFVHVPHPGEDCVANGLLLPALIVWRNKRKVLELDCKKLERETPRTLFSRLQSLMVVGLEEEEEATKGKDEACSSCGKPGCDRTFYHVHIPPPSTTKGAKRGGLEDDDEEEEENRD
jgi:hypothetical protein